jgi:hypothetical protein
MSMACCLKYFMKIKNQFKIFKKNKDGIKMLMSLQIYLTLQLTKMIILFLFVHVKTRMYTHFHSFMKFSKLMKMYILLMISRILITIILEIILTSLEMILNIENIYKFLLYAKA